MKKLITICLIVAATFTVKAQDGKPTKEETIKWLKDKFINNHDNTFNHGNLIIKSIDECTLIYTYDVGYYIGNDKY